jgi:hypothetical protein
MLVHTRYHRSYEYKVATDTILVYNTNTVTPVQIPVASLYYEYTKFWSNTELKHYVP